MPTRIGPERRRTHQQNWGSKDEQGTPHGNEQRDAIQGGIMDNSFRRNKQGGCGPRSCSMVLTKGQPCAFGPKGEMEDYAQRLNESKGEL